MKVKTQVKAGVTITNNNSGTLSGSTTVVSQNGGLLNFQI